MSIEEEWLQTLPQKDKQDIAALVAFGFTPNEACNLLITSEGRKTLNRLVFLKKNLPDEHAPDITTRPEFDNIPLGSERLAEQNPIKQLLRVETALKPRLKQQNGVLTSDADLVDWATKKVIKSEVQATLREMRA